MKRRKKNLYFGFGPASKAERARQRSYVRTGGAGRTVPGNESSALRNEVAEALVGQGYKKTDAKKAVQRASGGDFNSLFRSAIGGLKKNPRGITMATKKRKRKKNSRKGKMPAGLKAYWAKKRAKKNGAKKRRRTRKLNPRKRARRRKPVSLRVKNFRHAKRRPTVKQRRTRMRSNPRRAVKIIKTNLHKGTKAFEQFVREQRAKYGTARVL